MHEQAVMSMFGLPGLHCHGLPSAQLHWMVVTTALAITPPHFDAGARTFFEVLISAKITILSILPDGFLYLEPTATLLDENKPEVCEMDIGSHSHFVNSAAWKYKIFVLQLGLLEQASTVV
ncbi:hypothetical protein FB451DRAFT_1232875 [Mycena latifolia]|nr:hypothetical protein FB451DRAFT_1232875 [Mycena latifolia]